MKHPFIPDIPEMTLKWEKISMDLRKLRHEFIGATMLAFGPDAIKEREHLIYYLGRIDMIDACLQKVTFEIKTFLNRDIDKVQ